MEKREVESLEKERRRLMENETLKGPLTIKGLRKLREDWREVVGKDKAVCVTLELWRFQESAIKEVVESIDVWWSDCHSTQHFSSLREANEYLENARKEKTNG